MEKMQEIEILISELKAIQQEREWNDSPYDEMITLYEKIVCVIEPLQPSEKEPKYLASPRIDISYSIKAFKGWLSLLYDINKKIGSPEYVQLFYCPSWCRTKFEWMKHYGALELERLRSCLIILKKDKEVKL